MKKSLLLAAILVAFSSQAQLKNFLLHVSANSVMIKSGEETVKYNVIPIASATGYSSTTVNTGTIRQTFQGKVGFDVSGRFNCPLSNQFFISTGLSSAYWRFQRSLEVLSLNGTSALFVPRFPDGITVNQPGSPYGSIFPHGANGNGITPSTLSPSQSLGNTSIWNIQVPVLAGTSFLKEKLRVKAGLSFFYLLHVSEVKQQYTTTTSSISEYKDTSKEAYNAFQTGGLFETTYQIAKRIGIDVSVKHYFTPIYKEDISASSSRYNSISFGVGYTL